MFWDIFQFSLDNTMWSTQTNSWSQSTIPSHQIFKKWACTIVWESSSSMKKKMYKCIWQNKNWTRTNLSKKCLLATDCLCHIKLTTFCVWTLLIWINQRLEEESFSHPGVITVWMMLYCTLGEEILGHFLLVMWWLFGSFVSEPLIVCFDLLRVSGNFLLLTFISRLCHIQVGFYVGCKV